MPIIRFKENDLVRSVQISQSEFESLMNKIKDPKLLQNTFIEVTGAQFKKKDFVGYGSDDNLIAYEGYDISNPEHLKELNEFKEFLEALKITIESKKPLDYYGTPWEGHEGYVHNPIVGWVHWTEVQWALDEKLIGKYSGGNWFVGIDPEVPKQQATARKYDAYMAKKKALEKIRDKEYEKNQREKQLTDKENKALNNTNV